MSSDNTSQPSVKYCADKMNAKYIHGRPEPELVPSRYPPGIAWSAWPDARQHDQIECEGRQINESTNFALSMLRSPLPRVPALASLRLGVDRLLRVAVKRRLKDAMRDSSSSTAAITGSSRAISKPSWPVSSNLSAV